MYELDRLNRRHKRQELCGAQAREAKQTTQETGAVWFYELERLNRQHKRQELYGVRAREAKQTTQETGAV